MPGLMSRNFETLNNIVLKFSFISVPFWLTFITFLKSLSALHFPDSYVPFWLTF